MMKDTVFLFIKVVIRTKYQHIQDAMKGGSIGNRDY
jgi:hypothetical protein